jgi:hypothetical protein
MTAVNVGLISATLNFLTVSLPRPANLGVNFFLVKTLLFDLILLLLLFSLRATTLSDL